MDYELFRESVQVTQLILQKWKARIPESTTLLAFVSDHYKPQHGILKQSCQNAGIRFIDSVAYTVYQHKFAGETVHASDGYHWNEAGHRVVAQVLMQPLKAALTPP